jgi:quinol monooxygenase YgiN
MSYVMAVFDFKGDTADLEARYDALIDEVVAMSPARPIIHLAVPREYGLMVADVWTDEAALRAFANNPRFQEILRRHEMPEERLRVFPVHRLGWPVSAQPMYR